MKLLDFENINMDGDAKCLSYYDVLLRWMDVELLTGNYWLNDQIIAFYYEYLSREKNESHADILLIPGATAYLVLNAGMSLSFSDSFHSSS